MADVDVLLIGGGAASAACAEQLREDGFAGTILLVGREPDPPYERPPVTKGYLLGQQDRDATFLHPPQWWEEHGVEMRTRVSVTRLDPGARRAVLSTREEVAYEHALLATGANVRRLSVEGSGLEGLHYLRTLRNADALRDDVAPTRAPDSGGGASPVVCVGGSFVGAEVAASLTAMGRRCTIVMQEDVLLSRACGERAGRHLERVLRDHGVEIRGGQDVARFEGTGGRVERVVCSSGLQLAADAVVLGVGAIPDVMLARAAGLELGATGGVACDGALRTAAPGLWAAGDVCEYDSVLHGRRLRVEHWDVAIEQGRHVARAMAGDIQPYDVVPYFFSDLADWASLEAVGPALRWDDEEVRGSPEHDGEFSIFYRDGGRLVGALTMGRPGDLEEARAMLRAG